MCRFPQRMHTVSLSPGQTADVYFEADNPGIGMLPCHELHHAESGTMTTILYDEPSNAGHRGEHG